MKPYVLDESRINALVSPEQRRAIELEKLVKEMA